MIHFLQASRFAIFAIAFSLLHAFLPTYAETPITHEAAGLTPEDKEPWVTPTGNIRARYEYGELSTRNPSHAATLRSRLGLLTKEFQGFQGFIEYEGTLALDRNDYQAASVHGLGRGNTIIADPESHEINQLWLSYADIENLKVKAGRQAIALNNQRFVGGVAWRQNMQTFDAASLTFTPTEDFTVFYAYVNQVNRIFGSGTVNAPGQKDFQGNTHLVNAIYDGLPIGKLTTYAYFMDLDNNGGSANSNHSYGASLAGPFFCDSLTYHAELAYQNDAFDNLANYATIYGHGKLTAALGETGVSVTGGYEYLGSDNGVGFNFPLGTNHAFNGFADVFLATPPDGLQDYYAQISAKLPAGINLSLWYHHFNNDAGASLGQEGDIVLSKKFNEKTTALIKYAYFEGDDPRFPDLHRLTAQVEFKF